LSASTVRWPDSGDLVFVKDSSEIGAGVISDGTLRPGALGAAGDLGHIAVPHSPAVRCWCGNEGCLETVASGRAVVAAMREVGAEVQAVKGVVERDRAGAHAATHVFRYTGS